MGRKTEWRIHAGIGFVLVASTFTKIAPAGPWGDESFTSGSIGLVGLCFLYVAWFRLTFDVRGIVPTIDRWQNPAGTSPKVIGVGLVIMAIAYGAGRIDFFPDPAGMIIGLIGLLTIANGLYVWMTTVGPLSTDKEVVEVLIVDEEE